MRVRRTTALGIGLVVLVVACTSNGKGTPSASSSGARTTATCTVDSATEAHQFVVAPDGFSTTCGRVTKGTTVLFVNATGAPAEVTLSHGDADDFDAQLPNQGSTYAHAFNSSGTYVVTAKPSGSLTLFVVG